MSSETQGLQGSATVREFLGEIEERTERVSSALADLTGDLESVLTMQHPPPDEPGCDKSVDAPPVIVAMRKVANRLRRIGDDLEELRNRLRL